MLNKEANSKENNLNSHHCCSHNPIIMKHYHGFGSHGAQVQLDLTFCEVPVF